MQEDSAPAAALADNDPARRAREEFYSTFDEHCVSLMLPDAERRLGVIFQQTVAHAIYNAGVKWEEEPDRRRVALLGIRKIAVRTQRVAGLTVSEAELGPVADRVIRELSVRCNALFAPQKVFCEAYEYSADADAPSARESATEPDPEMVKRARFDFMAHAESWAAGKFDEDARKYLTNKLFKQTVRAAIFDAELNWDTDKPRKEFVLRRLAEVAELARFKARDGSVTRSKLHEAARAVIGIWKDDCTMEGRFEKRIFCDAFTQDSEDA
jgi:hypothetical protein